MLRQRDLDTNLFYQAHNQRMRLYIANVILGDTILPVTTHDHTTTGQIGTEKNTTNNDADPTTKRMRQKNGEDTKEDITNAGALKACVAQCT